MAVVAILDIGSLAKLRGFECAKVIYHFIVQSRQCVLLKYVMTAIDLINLGHALADFRSDKQRFITLGLLPNRYR